MNRQLQLFAKLNSPYYIHAPAFTSGSGGIRAMHYLCHALNLAGEEAYVTTDTVSPGLRTPTLSVKDVARHRLENREPITVYPEVVSGNPSDARCVVRYLLNIPGFLHQKEYMWGADDLIYAHGSCVVPAGVDAELLQLPLINTSIYNRDGVDDTKRSGSLLFINRYLHRGGKLSPITEGFTEISFRVFRRTPEQLAALYRSAELLYTYEPSTACYEAMLCGCPVVYLPNNVMLNMPPPSYLTDVGSAWGNSPEQIEHAQRTIHRVPEIYEQVNQSFLRELEAFIDRTQQHVRKGPPLQIAPATNVEVKKRVVLMSADPVGATAPLMRIIKPLGFAPQNWEVISGLQDGQVTLDLGNPPQLIVLQRSIAGIFSIDTLKQLFALGAPIVYDTDARFDVSPGRQSDNFQASIEYTVQHADAVIVANEQLAEVYRALSPRVHVVPSLVDFELFECPVSAATPAVRIGVFGNSLEPSNFALLKKVIRKIQARFGDLVNFTLVGETPPAGWVTSTGATFVKMAPTLESRARQLRELQLDAGLVPLENTAFNESGSTVTYLEFSAAGLVTIASARATFCAVIQNGYDGLLVDDTEQGWVDAIGKLIEAPALRRQLAYTAQAKVRRWHALRELPASLQNALATALGGQPAPPSQTANEPAVVRGVLILDPDGRGNHIDQTFGYIDSTPYKDLIRVVLTTQQDAVPEWTTKLRYLKAADLQEYAAAAGQLLALPTFDWALVTEVESVQAEIQCQ